MQDSELENIFTELNAGHIAYDPSDISTLKISFYLNTMNGKPLEQSPKPLTIKN
ncbi:MAG: hypothetical protein IPN46_15425 [Saprospiraceae bacterium]|nr:hypothetical protein [Saprospiraceae bacterium]